MKHVGVGASALGAATDALAESTPMPAKRPNVLVFVADDWGMNDASCYGNPFVKTPGIDDLAANGVRFTHAFCTTPSCSPSRSVLLSGMHNHANGQYGLAHGYHHFAGFSDLKTLPVILSESGYRTICAGKHHVNPEPTYHFQEYITGPSPVDMANQCEALLSASSDSPFFLYFCTSEPHRSFKREGSDPVDPTAITVPPHLPDTPECREDLAEYYESIQRADTGMVRLIELVRDTCHWDDTLIFCLSDNGMPWPGAKTTLYEPGVHLPCIVRDPLSSAHGKTCDAMISWVDISPSVLEYCGLGESSKNMHGRSFLGAMNDEHPEGWDEVYCSHTFHEVTMYYPMRSVRTRKHKLIWNIAHGLGFPFASDLWKSKTWQVVLERELDQY